MAEVLTDSRKSELKQQFENTALYYIECRTDAELAYLEELAALERQKRDADPLCYHRQLLELRRLFEELLRRERDMRRLADEAVLVKFEELSATVEAEVAAVKPARARKKVSAKP